MGRDGYTGRAVPNNPTFPGRFPTRVEPNRSAVGVIVRRTRAHGHGGGFAIRKSFGNGEFPMGRRALIFPSWRTSEHGQDQGRNERRR